MTPNPELQRSLWWRGKVVGGTGAINTMVSMRGNRNDYDEWERTLGSGEWSYGSCLSYFKKLENMLNVPMRTLGGDMKQSKRNSGSNPAHSCLGYYHGREGPMFVEDARHHSPLREAFLRAGQWLGYDVVDQNGGSQAGFAPYQFNIYRGGEAPSKSGTEPICKTRFRLQMDNRAGLPRSHKAQPGHCAPDPRRTHLVRPIQPAPRRRGQGRQPRSTFSKWQ